MEDAAANAVLFLWLIILCVYGILLLDWIGRRIERRSKHPRQM